MATLRRWLEERLETLPGGSGAGGRGGGSGPRAIPTGWAEIDAALGGGLRAGGVHEWHAGEPGARGRAWAPPLTILAHAALACARGLRTPMGDRDADPGWIAWIGRRVWAYGPALARMGGAFALRRSLLIDPDGRETRVWAIDTALRCPALVVVADGSGLSLAETRRLQLAAEAGGSLALLARPGWERRARSASATRWVVRSRAPTEGARRQRWEVELSARKGARPTSTHAERWVLERSVDGVVGVVPVLGVRRGEAALAS